MCPEQAVRPTLMFVVMNVHYRVHNSTPLCSLLVKSAQEIIPASLNYFSFKINKILYTFLIYFIRATYPTHINLIVFIFIIFNPLRAECNQNCILRLIPYRAVNTLHVHYKNLSVKSLQEKILLRF